MAAQDSVVDSEGVLRWLRLFAGRVAERRDELTELDAAIGDADHGINLDHGMQAVMGRLDQVGNVPVAELLKTTGMTLLSTVGGAAGPLYGTLFLKMGGALADRAEVTGRDWAQALRQGVTSLQARGRAQWGDKTMLDVLLPALDALEQALDEGQDLRAGLAAATDAAKDGMLATVPLVARKGRASYLGERSAGHQDPGATSSYLLIASAAEIVDAGDGS